jgi:nucleoside-diphosphate-sugar epimerase
MILITGGTGLTGSFVVRELARRGTAVRSLHRRGVPVDCVDAVEGDLAQPDTLRSAARGVHGIVHAACTFVDESTDIAAMGVLLDAWEHGPFVYISSLDVYGFTRADPVTENEPRDGAINAYARGKITCETMLEERARARGRSDFAILRAAYIFGPHERSVERLIDARLRHGRPIVLPGASYAEWSTYRDAWIDVRDLAWIAAECVTRPPGCAVNALAGHFVWHELYRTLAALIGSASTVVQKDIASITSAELPDKQLRAQSWYFSNHTLRTCLNFQPQHTLLDTLEAVAAMHNRKAV